MLLITGAAKRLGVALAKGLAKDGHRIAIHYFVLTIASREGIAIADVPWLELSPLKTRFATHSRAPRSCRSNRHSLTLGLLIPITE